MRDAVRAYYMLVTCSPVAGEYYNIGGTLTATIRQMLDTLMSMSTYPGEIKVTVDPDRLRPIDADLQVPDTAKFNAHTGWEPLIAFETTMKDLLDYWRSRVQEDGQNFLNR